MSGGTASPTRSKRREVDMTQGSVFWHLFRFALPLVAGNLFQQLYNMVDTWVVGNYVSNEAFSAVGTVTPIVMMLIGSFSALAGGAGVVISQHYGAKSLDRVQKTVHTAIVMTVVLTVVFTLAGVLLTPTLLRFMKTPAEVFPQSSAYLTIYFSGMVGLLFYNMGASILRAVGDSRRPFYYLVVAAVLNVILDLLFVIKFQMGVQGVAWATVIAQGVSAVLVMVTLLRTSSCVRLEVKHLGVDRILLKQILYVGIPSAVQMAVTAFSNVFVQSYINQFGADCMGGWTAYAKVDPFVYLPMQSLALACTTFVGQNLGRGQVERAYKGVRTSMAMAMVSTVVLSGTVIGLAPHIVTFFNSKPEVVSYGTLFLRRMIPFFVIVCISEILAGALRGAGNSRTPVIMMLTFYVAFRQVYLYVMSNFISNTILPLALGYPAGWVLFSAAILIYYRKRGLRDSLMEIKE